MKISVIIPTYKPGRYFEDCIECLCSQTLNHEDFETIIVLNGEKEPYWSNIHSCIEKHRLANVNLLYSAESGVSVARNLALDRACGEYICFIDDDDKVSESYLEDLLSCASNDTVSLSNILAFDDCSTELRPLYITKEFKPGRKKVKAPVVRRYLYSVCAKLIHKDMIGDRHFDVSLSNGEDAQFMLLISDKTPFFSFTGSEAKYKYRQREGSAFNKRKSIGYNLKNTIIRISNAIRIYTKQPSKYSIKLFTTYICATLMGGLRQIFNIKQ